MPSSPERKADQEILKHWKSQDDLGGALEQECREVFLRQITRQSGVSLTAEEFLRHTRRSTG